MSPARTCTPYLLSSLLLLSLLFTAALAQPAQVQGRALVPTSLYAEPSREALVNAQLAAGAIVQVLGYRLDRERAEWWHVELTTGGSTGFVPASAMKALRSPAAPASASAGSSLFAQMVGGDSAPAAREEAGGGESLFSQMARSGDIERGQAATRQQALEEELRREEQALLERERREQQRLAAEEERLRREEEALRRNDGWDGGGWQDDSPRPSIAAGLADRIQQGFQELNELQRSTHEDTMRNLELMRQAQERQARERQQQGEWQAQQQRERDQRQRQVEQERQRLAEERQRRERELAQQRAALEARRSQPSPPPAPAAAAPAAAAPSAPPTSQARSGNPGRSAPDCIRVGHEDAWRDDAYNIVFSNACDRQVFVIWCARSPYGLNCGENVANFYASSVNLRPGQRYSALVQGRVTWGACEGTIGFGHVDFYSDHPNGDYSCLPTGDHARAQAAPQRVSPRNQDLR
ncbi:MAG: hypothetical protein JJT85_02795 [Chromatiales bacterium]|nr:hypothetical protein [Chromatiales bacterium]